MTRFTVIALVALVAGCQAEPVSAPAPVGANQEPVAALTVPDGAQAGVPVTVTAAALDVDGAVVKAALTFGDGGDPEVVDVNAGGPLSWTHTYASAGLFDVELTITDDQGLTGRARTRLLVDAAPDSGAPSLGAVALSLDGAPLDDGARVVPGSTITVDASASDAEGNLDRVDVSAGPATASITLAGAEAAGSASLQVGGAGDVVVRAVAFDLFGNASAPVEHTLHVVGPGDDSDGDGLPDLTDPAPDVYNGVAADVFAVDGIPHDLLGNDRAEKLVSDLDEATPDAGLDVAAGWLAVPHTTASLDTVLAGAPDTSADFAVRYAGDLVVPDGVDEVVVDVTAEGTAVVLLDGTPVASSDGEYATDFFRLDRVPATSAPVAVTAGAHVPLVAVVAAGEGGYAWSLRFTFLSGGAIVVAPDAVTQRQFEVTP